MTDICRFFIFVKPESDSKIDRESVNGFDLTVLQIEWIIFNFLLIKLRLMFELIEIILAVGGIKLLSQLILIVASFLLRVCAVLLLSFSLFPCFGVFALILSWLPCLARSQLVANMLFELFLLLLFLQLLFLLLDFWVPDDSLSFHPWCEARHFLKRCLVSKQLLLVKPFNSEHLFLELEIVCYLLLVLLLLTSEDNVRVECLLEHQLVQVNLIEFVLLGLHSFKVVDYDTLVKLTWTWFLQSIIFFSIDLDFDSRLLYKLLSEGHIHVCVVVKLELLAFLNLGRHVCATFCIQSHWCDLDAFLRADIDNLWRDCFRLELHVLCLHFLHLKAADFLDLDVFIVGLSKWVREEQWEAQHDQKTTQKDLHWQII